MTEKFHQVSSEVRQGVRSTVMWHLKGWERTKDFDLLVQNANCHLNIAGLDTQELNTRKENSRARLRFYFRDWEDVRDMNFLSHEEMITRYLSLNCDQLNITKDMGILGYDFRVQFVDDKLNLVKEESAVEKNILIADKNDDGETTSNHEYSQIIVAKKFITLAECETEMFGYASNTFSHPRPADLRLKISVTPILLSTIVKTADEPNSEDEFSICQALKNIFISDENYADVDLLTKDGMILKAHKFMLAARSPKLRSLMKNQLKEVDFDGTIKLHNVTGDALKVILHWIYTGELHENAGNCMAQVLEAAIHFRLGKMIQLLERKLEMGCNKENMFEFYKVAQANGLMTAADEISTFIKRNIPKDGHPLDD